MRFLVEVEIEGRVFRRELTQIDDAHIEKATTVTAILRDLGSDIFQELLNLPRPRGQGVTNSLTAHVQEAIRREKEATNVQP